MATLVPVMIGKAAGTVFVKAAFLKAAYLSSVGTPIAEYAKRKLSDVPYMNTTVLFYAPVIVISTSLSYVLSAEGQDPGPLLGSSFIGTAAGIAAAKTLSALFARCSFNQNPPRLQGRAQQAANSSSELA